MTKDEALKLALETLEQIQEGCNSVIADKRNAKIAVDLAKLVKKDCNKPIDAIRKFLAQPEQESDDLTIAYLSGFYDGKNKNAPQPEPEPVAMRYDFDGYGWLYIDNGSGSNWKEKIKNAEPLFTAPSHPKSDQEPVTLQINSIPPFKNPPNDVIDAAFHVSDWAQRNNWTKWRIGKCCSVDYTAPPQRKPLTDEQIEKMIVANLETWNSKSAMASFVRAIEAAHGIKGE